MDDLINPVTVVSLGVTALMAAISIVLGFKLEKRLAQVEKWALSWLVFDGMTHLTLELAFLYFSLTGTVESSTHFSALLWKEYGKADKRWLISDPTVVSLEILTVVVDGLLCLVLIYAIVKDRSYRHFVQVVLCVCELYGGWMTFCPEWLTGSPNLVTDNVLYLWVYLIFFNGIWVVIPLALLCQSYIAMTTGHLKASFEKSSPSKKNKKSPKKQNGGRVQVLSSAVDSEFKNKYNTRSKKER
ncbi:hypothetical protein LOTGIDRAFT_211745 [Lottia gigantea]|uniref:EXPERA domain-containing protein n=1 Tax=Lottia gigantea TaxID=225164 RepID=V4BBK4_LOTGI|nr:hypothetical protein LOTGIDRAFT_211745 [Lottia gigantea]ESP04941.1 hypothetical protein LOTGIDRAFT_211745 [Lottia gigantea]